MDAGFSLGKVRYEGSYANAFDGCLDGDFLRYAWCLRLGLHESSEVISQSFPLTLLTLEDVYRSQ